AATTTDQPGARIRGGVPGTTGTLTINGNAWAAANTPSPTGKLRGGGLEVEVSRTGGNGTAGTADAGRVAFGGWMDFRGLDTGTPTAASPKFVIELVNGTNPLQQGEA